VARNDGTPGKVAIVQTTQTDSPPNLDQKSPQLLKDIERIVNELTKFSLHMKNKAPKFLERLQGGDQTDIDKYWDVNHRIDAAVSALCAIANGFEELGLQTNSKIDHTKF